MWLSGVHRGSLTPSDSHVVAISVAPPGSSVPLSHRKRTVAPTLRFEAEPETTDAFCTVGADVAHKIAGETETWRRVTRYKTGFP